MEVIPSKSKRENTDDSVITWVVRRVGDIESDDSFGDSEGEDVAVIKLFKNSGAVFYVKINDSYTKEDVIAGINYKLPRNSEGNVSDFARDDIVTYVSIILDNVDYYVTKDSGGQIQQNPKCVVRFPICEGFSASDNAGAFAVVKRIKEQFDCYKSQSSDFLVMPYLDIKERHMIALVIKDKRDYVVYFDMAKDLKVRGYGKIWFYREPLMDMQRRSGAAQQGEAGMVKGDLDLAWLPCNTNNCSFVTQSFLGFVAHHGELFNEFMAYLFKGERRAEKMRGFGKIESFKTLLRGEYEEALRQLRLVSGERGQTELQKDSGNATNTDSIPEIKRLPDGLDALKCVRTDNTEAKVGSEVKGEPSKIQQAQTTIQNH